MVDEQKIPGQKPVSERLKRFRAAREVGRLGYFEQFYAEHNNEIGIGVVRDVQTGEIFKAWFKAIPSKEKQLKSKVATLNKNMNKYFEIQGIEMIEETSGDLAVVVERAVDKEQKGDEKGKEV